VLETTDEKRSLEILRKVRMTDDILSVDEFIKHAVSALQSTLRAERELSE